MAASAVAAAAVTSQHRDSQSTSSKILRAFRLPPAPPSQQALRCRTQSRAERNATLSAPRSNAVAAGAAPAATPLRS
jgi:hypothetical protein